MFIQQNKTLKTSVHNNLTRVNKSRKSFGSKSSRGFTLMEVLVALFITSGAIAVVANTWAGNSMRMRKMVQQNRVAFLLERKMTETKIKYQNAITSIPQKASGDFPIESKNGGSEKYSWEIQSQPFELPSLSSLLVAQGTQLDQTMLSFMDQLTEFFGQAVKEVTVSVIIKSKGKKSSRYSATTYFVDYNQQLPAITAMQGMGGGGGGGSGGPQTGGAGAGGPATGQTPPPLGPGR